MTETGDKTVYRYLRQQSAPARSHNIQPLRRLLTNFSDSSMMSRFSGGSLSITMEELDNSYRPVFDRLYEEARTSSDGKIPLAEVREILLFSGSVWDKNLPMEVIDELLESSDKNKDGELSYEEFLAMVKANGLHGSKKSAFRKFLRYSAFTVIPRGQRTSDVRRYLDKYSCYPPPLFMILISILEIMVFCYHAIHFSQNHCVSISIKGPVPFCSLMIYDPYRRHQVWRFASYSLVHAGTFHIVLNILVQLVIGIPLEMVHRWWRVLVVYFSGVLAGSFATSATDPGVYLAGASGGVYALVAAHLATIILNWSEMDCPTFRFLMFTTVLVFDLSVALYSRHVLGTATGVGYTSHLAGVVAGLLIGINVLKNVKTSHWENVCWWVSLVLYILLMGGFVTWNLVGNLLVPNYFPPLEFEPLNDQNCPHYDLCGDENGKNHTLPIL